MDSRPKADVGVPQAELSEVRLEAEKTRRTNRGLVVAVIVLAVAVVGLGTFLIASTQEDEGGVTGSSEWLIDQFTSAVNRSDGNAAAAVFTEDGFIRIADGTVYEGKSEIEGFVDALPPMNYAQIGDLTGDETRVTGTFSYSSDEGSGTLTREFVFVGDDMASVTDSGAGSEGAVSQETAPQGTDTSLVSTEHVAAIAGMIAALNAGDAQGAAEYYAEDAVITYWGDPLAGRDAVAGFFENYVVANGWQYKQIGPAIGYGDVVAAIVYVEDESGGLMTYLSVDSFDAAGRIRDEAYMHVLEA